MLRDLAICVEDDELEPFFEQKRDCKRLIAYLEKLDSQLNRNDVPDIKVTTNDSSDSGDEFPSAFQKLSIPPTKSSISLKKSGYGGKKIKPTQPLSHAFEIYNMFGSIDVAVPNVYQDVSKALEEVNLKLLLHLDIKLSIHSCPHRQEYPDCQPPTKQMGDTDEGISSTNSMAV
uniref:Ras-GEF domain-containing protein n=1 Tax=Heterorhabditis bacteriophora TaxID=37862 RepID=A0A1I7X6Q6_HETBA